ncbi:hypothetical protein EON65_40260 [archaeon]|nr:MAG: hypothetical protein EON65_40260 [archaeon]
MGPQVIGGKVWSYSSKLLQEQAALKSKQEHHEQEKRQVAKKQRVDTEFPEDVGDIQEELVHVCCWHLCIWYGYYGICNEV